MPRPRSYQDLKVWERAIELAELVYRLSAKFPAEERYELTRQVRRAAISVSANIAEGAGRNGTREFVHFLGVASGSLSETDSHLVLSSRLGIARQEDVERVRDHVAEVGRSFAGLKRSLRDRTNATNH